jgi:DNA-binding beta-propeller fold protein YncE
VLRLNITQNILSSHFIWLKLLAIPIIIGSVWLASGLILSPHIISSVHAQEYTPALKWGRFGLANGSFNLPEGIAVDPSSGNVFVADTANNRIQVFSSNGTFITTWGRFGLVNGLFNSPEGIAVGQQGNVFVADTANNRIQVFSSNGTFITTWGRFGLVDGNFVYPEGIAVGQQGNVFVADTANNRIQVFSPLSLS